MKFQIKTDQNMDYDDKIKINKSWGYFWQNSKVSRNSNFYDYQIQEANELFVIEGLPEFDFKKSLSDNTDGLSIGNNEVIDIKCIYNLCPDIKVLFLKCESILNADHIQYFNKLEYISIVGSKNINTKFVLPFQLKSFICIWKSKFRLEVSKNNQLEYINIENGLTFDFDTIFRLSPRLKKIELLKCNLNCSLACITTLKCLTYLSLSNCSIIENSSLATNNSMKYLYISKTKFNWSLLEYFVGLEVLFFEDCEEIATIDFLDKLLNIRGLWISGNTKIIDGNLFVLEKLIYLQNLFVRDYNHYTHKSVNFWDWNRFSLNKKIKYEKVFRRK